MMTEGQKEFIKQNYPEKGSRYCSDVLGLPAKRIGGFCAVNKIKVTSIRMANKNKASIKCAQNSRKNYYQNKPYEDYKVNPSQFININSPEIAYILGLLWADGYVRIKGYSNSISIECIEKDLNLLKDIFLKTGKWCMNHRKRTNRQPQMVITTNNKILAKFLQDNGYVSKSELSACKILSKIPDELKYYWFRGLIDGDGCFYQSKNEYCNQLSIASSYHQDWTYLESLFKKMKISYGICRRIQGENKSSIIRISNKRDINKFGNYIYKDYLNDKIGLERKYLKFKKISDVYQKSLNLCWT